ncbi:hypothetical protein PAXRUDRAFT_757439 [Paxillus rubicundulus Ve08.2h10]|uniref:Uncharacterized protein n=1 Tax=Paxillus rubicundulus Ve08.2h10 TaxID=930991 RepID=A0A0D0DQ94_9AGAM|nr:hypothetical protein PAXRUDRAFT_757439 [Paxillus rubicundulus Ve08.2h10]
MATDCRIDQGVMPARVLPGPCQWLLKHVSSAIRTTYQETSQASVQNDVDERIFDEPYTPDAQLLMPLSSTDRRKTWEANQQAMGGHGLKRCEQLVVSLGAKYLNLDDP